MKLRIPIKLTKYFLCIALSVIIYACGEQVQKDNERSMDSVVKLIENTPDSAFNLLNTIDIRQLNPLNEARYQTLMTRIKDKFGIDISSDSVVFRARNHLVEAKDSYAGLACLVSASVYEVQGSMEKALYDYLKAYDIIQDDDDYLLNGSICYNLARIFYTHRIYSESLPYAKKAVKYDELAGVQGESKTYTLELLGYTYYYLDETDSALIYLDKALEVAKQHSTLSRIYFTTAVSYHRKKVYSYASKMYRYSLSFGDSTDNINVGKCFLGLQVFIMRPIKTILPDTMSIRQKSCWGTLT